MATVIDVPTSFASEFDGLQSTSEVNATFKRLYLEYGITGVYDPNYWPLHDANRDAMAALIGDTRRSRSVSHDDDGVSSRKLRNWALREGLPLAKKGRVSRDVENAYRSAHDMKLLDDGIEIGSPADIRRWAIANDIAVAVSGRIHLDVVEQYNAAHGKDGDDE